MLWFRKYFSSVNKRLFPSVKDSYLSIPRRASTPLLPSRAGFMKSNQRTGACGTTTQLFGIAGTFQKKSKAISDLFFFFQETGTIDAAFCLSTWYRGVQDICSGRNQQLIKSYQENETDLELKLYIENQNNAFSERFYIDSMT